MKNYKVSSLDYYGRGVIKDDNKVIFVENALVDEIINIEIVNEKKKFCEAKVTKYIKESPLRIKPICPYYDKCGGCDIMHISYEEQLKFKKNKVKEIMDKFKIDVPVMNVIPTNQFGYRNKVTLHNNKKLGFFKKNSYDVIEVEKCLIASDKINIELLKLNKNYKGKQIVIRSTEDDSTVIYDGKDGKRLIENISGFKYRISPKAFFQVNKDGMIKLYDKVLEYVDLNLNDIVLDLYCGTGTIGIYLSPYCKEVLGIELNSDAINDAIYNQKLNNVNNIKFKLGDVSKVISNVKYKPTVIVVDPPRSGLDKNTINYLLDSNSQKIVYVSCDVVTLARDLKLLEEKYNILEITPVDMFPNTHHIECVCLLKCKYNKKNKC